jgi:nucleoside-diphosphate-sugar epimerase
VTRILVTGAAGFTGRYMGELLSEQGHEVHGLVHGYEGGPIAGYARLYEGDLSNAHIVRGIAGEVVPDHVVHLAGIAFVAHEDLEQLYSVNVIGTRHLLDALSSLPDKPKSVLVASSANVYGNSRAGLLEETSPPEPANDYAVSKLAMEYVTAIYSRELPLIVARPFNYTGRGQSTQFVIPKIVEHARLRKPILELGNLEVARDFSDVRTIVDAYAKLLTAPGAIGETFNVCSGEATALQRVIDIVTELTGHRFEIKINPAFVRAHEVRNLRGGRAKIERVIGPLQSIPLESTIAWMLEG